MHIVCVFAPPTCFGALRHVRSARSSASMTRPPPSAISECSIRPPSPSTLITTSKPNALHSHSMCLAAFSTAMLDEIRGQFLGGGLVTKLMRLLLTHGLINH